MTVRNIIIRSSKNIEGSVRIFVMKSINAQGGFLFCSGWNFLKSVSVTSRLLERWEYLNEIIPIRKLVKITIFFFISDNFQLTFLAMAEESNLHQAGSFQPYFPILCTLQFICSVLLHDTKSCYSTSFGKCINGPHSSNNLRWHTVLNFDGNFVLFLGSVQLQAASKIRNCFC